MVMYTPDLKKTWMKDFDLQSIYTAERTEKIMKNGPKIGQIPIG